MTTLELLAPARNLECGIAAINHGADAVYIGAAQFGARAAAGNSIDDIAALCQYAHKYNAKVYVTVNTIVYDDEIASIRCLIADLDAVDADAVLVQDMAVFEMLNHHHMAAHASTQTDNRTVEKVKWLYDIGFRRAVLARELSLDEITEIHNAVPDMELEVFVHGALCVSYSGQCYVSQHCFHRSANRGECAQFCRMPFNLIDSDDKIIEQEKHVLSLKDMNQLSNLEQLADAGAKSFKIEGRLKDITYVKNVTAAYSQQLDDIVKRNPKKYKRASYGRTTYTFEPDLDKSFNRGFTSYFFSGRHKNISSIDTPKAKGEYVGVVKEIRDGSFTVAGLSSFANGDGLCFLNDNKQLEGFRVNKVVNNRLFPLSMPPRMRQGMRLYRNNDMVFERLLAKPSAERKVAISMTLSKTADGFSLKAEVPDWTSAVENVTIEHQTAERPQTENIKRQLTKLGNTIYQCEDIVLDIDKDYFIPGSVLNALRRGAIENLEKACVEQSKPTTVNDIAPSDAEAPRYDQGFMYNVSNRLAADFYRRHGVKVNVTSYEKEPQQNVPVMQCKYCIRYAMGHCVKNGGTKAEWKEPLYIEMTDGQRFKIQFDCSKCQMNVVI